MWTSRAPKVLGGGGAGEGDVGGVEAEVADGVGYGDAGDVVRARCSGDVGAG